MSSTTELSIAQQLNDSVATVIGTHHIKGFEKAYLIAEATSKLKELLTPKYMKPIMLLQGSRLGFKTDRSYPEETVKNCLIEAVLMGLQPHGNQFNIIAGNMYPTKEGLGYLLANFPKLRYQIIPGLPRIKDTSAAVEMNVKWQIGDNEITEEKLDIPIKVNKGMGTDAVLGKATRKARAWLYSTITGSEVTDGEIEDLDNGPVRTTISIDAKQVSKDKEYKRITDHIKKSKTVTELEQVESKLMDDNHIQLFENKKHELVFEE